MRTIVMLDEQGGKPQPRPVNDSSDYRNTTEETTQNFKNIEKKSFKTDIKRVAKLYKNRILYTMMQPKRKQRKHAKILLKRVQSRTK